MEENEMVGMTVVYEGELRCSAVHGPSQSRIETDAPADNHGKAERFSPTDLVGAALASCIATTLGIVAMRKGWKLEGMRIEVGKEMSTSGPRRIARLPVDIRMPVVMSDEDKIEVERIAHACPVRKSLDPGIEIPIQFRWP
jgi:putative redox protein